jgi:uncharacterized protein (TIGR03083 family)
MMDRDWYLEAIEREGTALVAACEAAPGAQVPACPEWTTDDLLGHVASVHNVWSRVVATPLHTIDEVIALESAGQPVPAAPVARAALLAALRAANDEQACWTWSSEHNVGFVRRFQATEALVHRIDAEQAAGRTVTIDDAAAAESIDVFLTYCCTGPVEGTAEVGGSVHVHCTDTEGEWTIADDGVLTRGHSKGDVAVRGRAADVMLALWRRGPLDDCEIFGDRSLAERFIARNSVE